MPDNIVNLAHRSDQLHRDAGTYYSRFYDDANRIYQLFDSYCWAYQLLLGEAEEASLLFFRNRMPVLHRDWIAGIELDEATWKDGNYRMLTYGAVDENGGDVIRYGDKYYYGVPAEWLPGAIPLPAGIIDVDFCCNQPVDPTAIYIRDADFRILPGNMLYFNDDPFRLFTSEGESPNRTLRIWLRSAYSDRRYLQDRLGVLTQTNGPSTIAYRDFCNLILDSIVEGTNYHRLVQLVCLLFDVPCTKEPDEVVQECGAFGNRQWLITDKHVYFAGIESNFLYQAGDRLSVGTCLTDAITPLRWRSLPDAASLFLERRFLGRDYLAGLVFPNRDVPIDYDSGTGRYTFSVVGKREDVARFWDELYLRNENAAELIRGGAGVVVGGSVAINPAAFIHANILYPRLQLFYVKYAMTGKNRLPMMNTSVFRRLLSPALLFSMIMEASPLDGDIVYGADAAATVSPTLATTEIDLTCSIDAMICES
jgi:hypothetical protein